MFISQKMVVSVTILLNLGCEIKALKTRNKTVHDPFIDIALLLDNSGSMLDAWPQATALWDGISNWIRNYYGKDMLIYGQTRFALIACATDRNIGFPPTRMPTLLHLMESNAANAEDRILRTFQQVMENTKVERLADNSAGCAESVADAIFLPAQGDRPNAANVAVYVIDCTFYDDNPTAQMDMMQKLQSKIQLFLFVCTKEPNATARRLMEKWVGTDKKIYIYKDRAELVKRMDEFLPKKWIMIIQCEYNGFTTTRCHYDSLGNCVKVVTSNIITHPSPKQYLEKEDECPENNTTTCDDTECGRIYTTTEKQQDTTTKETLPPPLTPVVQPGTATQTTISNVTGIPGKAEDDEETETNSGILIGVIVGILVLLLLIILILFLVLGRRRKKDAKKGHAHDTGLGQKQHEKDKGMKVDMTGAHGKGKGNGHALDQKHREKEKGMKADLTAAPSKTAKKGKGHGHTAAEKKRTKTPRNPKRR